MGRKLTEGHKRNLSESHKKFHNTKISSSPNKKFCSKCGQEKYLFEFYKNQQHCKECRREYYLNRREHYKQYIKCWRLKNINTLRAKRKIWEDNNKEHLRRYKFNYRIKNKKKILEHKYERLRNDLDFRMRHYINTRMRLALLNNFKVGSTVNLLGCSIKDYRIYLEKKFKKGMSWQNYGKVWEIDHKIPCASFDLSKESEQKKCFHYQNTQPLLVRENRKKGDKK